MADLGVDYSFARPGGQAIKNAGFNWVARYLASDSSKRLSTSERDELFNAGLAIVLVFEDLANNALNGDVQGVKDAQEALAQAQALGLPADRPIYFAIDFDANESQQALIDSYLRAAGTIIGASRIGVYGGYYVVKRCLDNGSAKWAWQTVAWSGGQVDSRVHIYQNGQSAFNGGADVDEARQTDFGQWPLGGDKMAIITTEMVVALSEGTQGTDPQSPDEYAQWVGKTDQQSFDDMVTHYANKGRARQSALEQQIADLQVKAPTPTTDGIKPLTQLDPLPVPTATPENPPAVQPPTPANQEKVNVFVALWRALFG